MRIGSGFDVHRLTENRKLILGGVDIGGWMAIPMRMFWCMP